MICTRNFETSFRGREKLNVFYVMTHRSTIAALAEKETFYLQTRYACALQSSPSKCLCHSRVAWLAWCQPEQGGETVCPMDSCKMSVTMQCTPSSWLGGSQCYRGVSESGWANRIKNWHDFFFLAFYGGLRLYKTYDRSIESCLFFKTIRHSM